MPTFADHIVAHLTDTALIKVEGADSHTFLHNQFTNDLRLVNDQTSQLSSYCSPKGRMLALFRIYKQGDAYYMAMPKSIVEPTIKRLRMFVLMSKVTFTDISDDTIHLGFSGPQSAKRLQALVGEVTTAIDGVSQHDGITIIQIPGPQPRFDLFGPTEKLTTLQQQLMADAREVDNNQWRLLDIHAGLPTIQAETIDTFVPQMVNLQAINALNFKKGCYPGQEIVARMHYLGKLKRRMFLAHVDSSTAPLPGASLFGPNNEQGLEHKSGTVVSAQLNPKGGCDLLAVLEIEATENSTIHLQSATGPTITLLDLPYTVTA